MAANKALSLSITYSVVGILVVGWVLAVSTSASTGC